MLESISLKNFKSFKSLDNLKFKPITILCGANSCGKSSILDSILLLKQTLESQSPNQILLLNGRFVGMGMFDNIVFKKKSENIVSIEFTVTGKISDFDKMRIPWPLLSREIFPSYSDNNEVKYIGTEKYTISYKADFSFKSDKEWRDRLIVKPISIKNMKAETKAYKNKELVAGLLLEIQHIIEDSYKINWNNFKPRYLSKRSHYQVNGKAKAKLEFANLFPTEPDIVENDELRRKMPQIVPTMRRINSILKNIFSSYSYIGPLREEPSRRYIYEDEIVEIGAKGENAAYLYLSESTKSITNSFFFDPENEEFYPQKTIELAEAVQKWATYMEIHDLKTESTNEILYLNLNASCYDDTRVSIADVGFGISQIFPIILEGLRMPKGGTLLLEQPEIHLHPNLQMKMADYFIATALSGKNLIVETHSDHIINRLVRRIVEDENDQLNDLIGIYFIKSTEDGSLYEEINVDDQYGITNWPDDFFDQVAKEQQKIMMAGLKKRKAARKQQST